MNLENQNFLSETVSTRTAELVAGTAIAGVAMYLGLNDQFPDYHYPFDLNGHASHPAAGIVVGYAIERSLAYVDRLKQYSRQITVGVGLAIASVFETKYNYWYRNTTSDPADTAYTMLGVFYGICCVKKKSHK